MPAVAAPWVVLPSVAPLLGGPTVDRLSLLFGAAAVAVAGLLVLRARPRLAVALWFVVVCFVPTWLELKVGFLVPPTTLVAAAIVLTLLPGLTSRSGVRLTVADGAVGLLFLACLAPLAVGASNATAATAVILRWLLPFLLGRLVLSRVPADWLYRCAAVAFCAVAVLAVLEYVTKVNPFVGLRADNVDYVTWSPLQERGGVLRVEGAFGHSIALGVSMAMVLPLVLASRFRTGTKLLMVALILLAQVFTLSRIGIICSVVAILVFVLFSRVGLSRRARELVVGAVVVGGLLAAPVLLSSFERAGAEASLSAEYRSRLTDLLGNMSILGLADNQHRTPAGDVYFGSFRSIDNALLLLGLTYGYVALGLALVLIAVLVVAVLRRRGNPAMIAVVAVTPAVATVALITQYEMFFWFMVGLAVAGLAQRRPREPLTEREERPVAAPKDQVGALS